MHTPCGKELCRLWGSFFANCSCARPSVSSSTKACTKAFGETDLPPFSNCAFLGMQKDWIAGSQNMNCYCSQPPLFSFFVPAVHFRNLIHSLLWRTHWLLQPFKIALGKAQDHWNSTLVLSVAHSSFSSYLKVVPRSWTAAWKPRSLPYFKIKAWAGSLGWCAHHQATVSAWASKAAPSTVFRKSRGGGDKKERAFFSVYIITLMIIVELTKFFREVITSPALGHYVLHSAGRGCFRTPLISK